MAYGDDKVTEFANLTPEELEVGPRARARLMLVLVLALPVWAAGRIRAAWERSSSWAE
jgi:hypothetical protein